MGLFGREARSPKPGLSESARNLVDAEIRYLGTLRRELASLLISSDPDLMRRAYEKAWHWESETAGNPELLRADEQAHVTRIPLFEEFDRIDTRDFLPYGESRRGLEDDDPLDAYLDLSRMMVFMRNRLQPDVKRRRPLHDEKQHKVLLDTVRTRRTAGSGPA